MLWNNSLTNVTTYWSFSKLSFSLCLSGFPTLATPNLHSLGAQVLAECLSWARLCSKHQGYDRAQKKPNRYLQGAYVAIETFSKQFVFLCVIWKRKACNNRMVRHHARPGGYPCALDESLTLSPTSRRCQMGVTKMGNLHRLESKHTHSTSPTGLLGHWLWRWPCSSPAGYCQTHVFFFVLFSLGFYTKEIPFLRVTVGLVSSVKHVTCPGLSCLQPLGSLLIVKIV